MYFILLYKRQTTVNPGQETTAIADEVRDRTPSPEPSTLETSEQVCPGESAESDLAVTDPTEADDAETESQSTVDWMHHLEQVKQTYFLERRNFW